ncbi:MAG: beta galactosidase jelly roll domain-containing protein [Bacteroidetes bacterium]|nr:beta galactosidase jelly roll domain-containing protein [Bacteroidota bacterium]
MTNSISIKRLILISALLLFLSSNISAAGDWDRILNLRGQWKFSIGDDKKWADIGYDDSNWETVRVPSFWEEEGFYGYNGYAWYRKEFVLAEILKDESVYISLGYIDDVDEVYLNGKFIGSSGKFPPDFKTAYNADRKYPVPAKYFNKNKKNVLAVRVFDATLGGGINSGDIGIYVKSYEFLVDKNLEGEWKFSTGDREEFKEKDFDDSKWNKIFVPGYWETQGYDEYNGVAWYRKTFTISSSFNDDQLVLLLGKIDDIDEAYLNGNLIGQTGSFSSDPENSNFNNEWQELRGYLFPSNLLNKNGVNVIAVRVYDSYINGGIYEGPIGIATQNNYRNAWKRISKKRSFWDVIFGK